MLPSLVTDEMSIMADFLLLGRRIACLRRDKQCWYQTVDAARVYSELMVRGWEMAGR